MSTSQSSGPFSGAEARVKLGHQRLLLDIRELVANPYPKITLYPNEDDIYHACLVFNPEHYHPLHLSISFPQEYPMHPPHVSMNSSVYHPHVFGTWICASVLGDDYTPAYTLKGLAIQLLSFFDSDSLEHEDLPQVDDLTYYQELNKMHLDDAYKCKKCGFGMTTIPREPRALPSSTSFDARVDRSPDEWPTIQSPITHSRSVRSHTSDSMTPSQGPTSSNSQTLPVSTKDSHVECNITRLPNEALLLIIEQLDDFEHLTNFARAWSRISLLVRDFGVIRQRELQCFCLKTSYRSAKLGVGVTVHRGQISSEFDLLSEEAYSDLYVRYSIQGLLFNYWLPLPISRHHWNRVRTETHRSLSEIAPKLKALSSGTSDAHVLFTFMNDIVVRLNQVTEKSSDGDSTKSTLRHASEKAIESYFHLFHLLVCLATEDPSIVSQANKLLRDFENGKRSKTDCPNLGHLLVALLISDVQVTDVLIKSIITEAITRNVVWLLDRKGADMPELSYMERNTVSAYRLDKTFQGSRTSYRLLMFSELFRRTARPSHEKPLNQVQDELCDRHGAPPRGAASHLAAEVRRLHTIDNFPAFMREMGLKNIPTPMSFTNVLRTTVRASMTRGYSKWAVDQNKAMRLRFVKDPHIQLTKSEREWTTQLHYGPSSSPPSYNFFPNMRAGQSGGGKRPQSGRGRRT